MKTLDDYSEIPMSNVDLTACGLPEQTIIMETTCAKRSCLFACLLNDIFLCLSVVTAVVVGWTY